jgi:type IV pilus assembly protein PilO
MTYADQDFIPVEGQEESPNYPSAFGITFTPKISGVIAGVVGILGATWLLLNVVQPTWEQNQQLRSDVESKESQVQQQQALQKKIAQRQLELQQANQQNKQVLSLFATEKTLDTLLLDLNSFVKARNGRLTNYEPGGGGQQGTPEAEGIVNDGSLGPAVNGKLKRQMYNVELEGSFVAIQSILRSFERLQTLLLIRDFNAEVSQAPSLKVINRGQVVPVIKTPNGRDIPTAQPPLRTTFKLEVLMPVTDEEAKAAAAQPTPQ